MATLITLTISVAKHEIEMEMGGNVEMKRL
jgi:hypothetical protein